MGERNISIDLLNPVAFLGVNNQHIDLLTARFPKLKIIARDNNIRVIGDEVEIELFANLVSSLMEHLNKKGALTADVIENMLNEDEYISVAYADSGKDVILYGQHGVVVKARTLNQQKIVDSVAINDLVFAIGPAGTGKTYTAVAIAVRALKNKEVKRIILTRPAVEAGENLGFLPGDLKEKLDPYMQPLYDALWDMIPSQKLSQYIEDRIIEIAPLAFMRGRTLDNAIVILDEAQNASSSQMKMFLTRLGRSAKFIVTGDITQIDLPRNQSSGLIHAMQILQNMEGIDFVMLDNRDIVRHKLVSKIIDAYSAEQ